MLDEPVITETVAEHIAVIHVTVPREDVRSVMGPARYELMAAVGTQGIATTGPWFTHHLRMDPKVFDFEIGVPVAAPISPAGRVLPGERPVMKVARTTYHGPYEGLASAWADFSDWIAARRYEPAPDLWERYVAGPESSSDPAMWQTEFERPLAA